ncbi:MAG: hypothetical protein K9J12_16055 [Melioribacteraceae bacterium]|nr:hypothetical protein [Melioribacteraceae bacterium]MCF8412621.1 hypothetical protein [Melioribacteraceae bacterium]
MKSRNQLYLLVMVVSFLLALLHVGFELTKSSIKIVDVSHILYNNQSGSILHRFEKNKPIQKVTINRNGRNTSVLSLAAGPLFKPYFGSKQFNIDNTYFDLGNIEFKDINSDGSDEIFVLHRTADSIYISVFDYKADSIIILSKKIFSRPEEALRNKWDVIPHSVGFDSDRNPKYFYISISSGHSIYPRGIYKIDLRNYEIVAKFETASPINRVAIYDFDNDGDREIFYITNAVYNTTNLPQMPVFNDLTDRMFYLDKDLNLIYHYGFPDSLLCTSWNLLNYKGKTLITYSSSEKNKNGSGNKKYLLTTPQNDTISSINYTSPQPLFLTSDKKDPRDYIPLPINNALRTIDNNFTLTKYTADLDLQNGRNVIQADDYFFIRYVDKIVWYDKYLNIIRSMEAPIFNFNAGYVFNYVKEGSDVYWIENDLVGYTIGKITPKVLWDYIQFPLIAFLLIPNFILLFLVVADRAKLYQNYLFHTFNREDAYLIITNHKLRIIESNINAKALFNVKRNSNLIVAVKQFPQLLEIVRNSISTLTSDRKEIELKQDEENLRLLVRFYVFKDRFNLLNSTFLYIENFTEAILKERSQVWSHAIQKVAHEIKTPLSSINLNLNYIRKTLAKRNQEDEEIGKDFDLVKNEVDRIKNLTNNLLKFANLQPPNKQMVLLDSVIQKSFRKFESYLNHEIELNYQNNYSHLCVNIDVAEIEEVLHVLTENAIDAVKGKGEINIIVSKEMMKLKVCVKNAGTGIKYADIEKIFNPYFTTKQDGTGLGLAIAKKILEDHGSKLNVISEKGLTEFYFYLEIVT